MRASTSAVAQKLLHRGLTASRSDVLRLGHIMRASGVGAPNPSPRRGLSQVVSAKKEGAEMEQSKGTGVSKTTEDTGKHLRRRMRRGLGPEALMGQQGLSPFGGLQRGLLAHPLFKDVEQALEQIDDLMGMTGMGATTPQSVSEALRMPGMSMDILETGEAFEIKVDLPGLCKSDLNIALTESKQPELFGPLLTISGKKEEGSTTPEEESENIWHRAERQVMTEFKRAVRLPPNVNTENIKAKMDLGVLHVTVGKKEPVKKEEEEHARMIDIE